MRARLAVTTMIAAGLLTGASALSAQAAEGELVWADESGAEHVVAGPGDGTCIPFTDDEGAELTATSLVNNTNRPVEVYEQPNCGGAGVWTLGAGEEFPNPTAKSAKVWLTDEYPK